MPTNILMPALSPTMTEGTLAKWLKAEGDTVKAGDVIAEIETDKATMEVEAVDEGKIGKIIVAAGTQNVAVNSVIAILLEEGETAGDVSQKSSNPVSQKASDQKVSGPVAQKISNPATPKSSHPDERIIASPLAKRVAEQIGVDVRTVSGSGPNGRIVRDDVLAAKGAGSATRAVPMPIAMGSEKINEFGMIYTDIPNNNIKKITAKRLLESKITIPHFYLTIECRIDALLAAREQINTQADGAFKLSVNDFIVKACANALQMYPAANVSWTDEAVRQYKYSDISVAVATPNGLMTPIVKQAETKGLRQISGEIKDLAKKAREGKLRPDEFQGGTFTVSNLGMYGIDEFGAIINPPQSCILAVGAAVEKPYVDDGNIAIGTFMKCTLSTDHRSVDGAVGAEFLKILKNYIENPIAMLV